MAKTPKLFRFPASLAAEIEEAAAVRGITQTALVERACREFLSPEHPAPAEVTPAAPEAKAVRGLSRQQRRARARAAAKMR